VAIQVIDHEIAVCAVHITDERLRDAIDRAYLQKYNTGALTCARISEARNPQPRPLSNRRWCSEEKYGDPPTRATR
jgi:hypothetical protein